MKKIKLVKISFLILILVLFFTIFSIAGCKSTTQKKLDVYVWEGYMPEEVVTLFEKETGIKLNIAFISTNEEMLNILKGGGRADIVMPTQSQVIRFYEDSLAQPLDIKNITNYEKVSKPLREKPWAKWDGNQMGSGKIYAIPYVFGTGGLVINTSKYTKSLDSIGWEILFETGLKGRVSGSNSFEMLMLILDMLGIPEENLITDTQGTLYSTKGKVIELKHNVLKFYDTNSEIIDLMKNEEVWISHIEDGAGRELSQFDVKFKYVLPKQGGFGWTDTFMIPAEAANPAGANLFIDFMLRPDIAAILTDQSGYTTTIEGALELTKVIDKNLYRFNDEQLAKLSWQPNFSDEVRSNALTFWEELTTVQ